MSTRITTSMVQRNVLADLNAVSAKLTKSQMKAASGKEISRPSDDPFHAAQAMGLRGGLAGPSSTSATCRTRRAGRR